VFSTQKKGNFLPGKGNTIEILFPFIQKENQIKTKRTQDALARLTSFAPFEKQFALLVSV